ncbi:MAG: TrbI/VirB10 family protein, partial [bacterium]
NRIKPINKYKNKIINYKKRFRPNIFNYTSSDKNNNLKIANQRKFSKKFYREMQLLKKLKNYKDTGDNSNIDKNNLKKAKKNLLPINKKIVVFIKQSYARSILKNEKEANKRANKNNIKLGNLNYYKKAADTKMSTAVIPVGTVVNAYIKYKIFSYNTEVPVIAILSNTYYYKKKPFLKKGDKFFGMVSVKHSLDRLNIHFNRIIKTNGLSIGINAIAMMPNGSGGVKGNVQHHYGANVLTSLAQGVVGAAALFAGGGSAVNSANPYTFQNQIRQNVAQNELGQAQNGLNSIASSTQQITITLPKGTPIKIIFLRSVNIK